MGGRLPRYVRLNDCPAEVFTGWRVNEGARPVKNSRGPIMDLHWESGMGINVMFRGMEVSIFGCWCKLKDWTCRLIQ
jgi:hypothetical protein